jgi:single-strand DNA-binding protein
MSLNKVTIIGRLGRDPENTASKSGMAISKFSLATTEIGKDKQKETMWHNCVAFDKTAEIIFNYVHKGDNLYIEGVLKQNNYQGKDGTNVKSYNIIVNKVVLLGFKHESNDKKEDSKDAQDDLFNDDIPF